MGLVSERKRGGTNTVKTRDHVVKGRERVGKGGRSGRRKKSVLQQESVVTIEIHEDLEGDVGITWLSVFPLPFGSVKFVVTIVVAGIAVARENFSDTLQWAEDREVTEETVGGGVARRSQWDVTEHCW